MTAPAVPPSAFSSPWRGAVLAMAASLLPHLEALVSGQSYYFRDFSVTFYPLRLFQARELAEGRLPAWNPYIHEGSFAMPILYPFDLLHAFWPGPAAMSWLLTLHFPLAALGAWWLARELGASDAASAFTGAVYSLGGLAVSSLNLYVFLQALALAPFAAGALRRAGREGGRWIALAGAAVGLSVTTLAVEFVAQAVVLGLALSWAAAPSSRGAGRAFAAVLLGAGLAATPIAVLVGFVPDTVRGMGFARDVALGNEMHPMALLQVVVPELFGSLSRPVEQWWGGRFFSKGFPYFVSLFVGAVPLAAATAGWPGVERRTRLALGACALLGLWVALGERGGLAQLLTFVPFARWFRFPSKALLWPFVAVALWSGFGFDRLRSREPWGRIRILLLGLSAIAALPALAVLFAPSVLEASAGVPAWAQSRLLASSLTAAAIGLAAAVLAAVVLRGHAAPARAAVLFALVGVAELARAAAGMNPQVPTAFFQPLPEMGALGLAGQGRVFSYGPDTSPAFHRFLASGEPGLGLWSFFVNRQVLAPYANIVDRVETFEAKDITAFVPRPQELQPEDYDPRRVGLVLNRLRNAAVTHVMSLDRLADPALTLVARVPTGRPGLDIHVFRLQGSWPRVYAACHAVAALDPDDALQHPFRAGFDPTRDVALEGSVASAGAAGGCTSGTARRVDGVAGDEAYDVALEAGSGHLVVRQSHARGWRAWVDGVPAPVVRANGKHLAVAVGAGRHQVRLQYVAPGRRAGLVVSLMSLAAGLALLAGAGGQKRSR
jgi:membrane protein YfhO